MKGFREGLYVVVGICLLLLGSGTKVRAQVDDFAEVERRALYGGIDDLELISKKELKLTTELGAKFTQAQMIYEEHASVAKGDSNWEAWLIRADFTAAAYFETDAGNNIGLEADLGLFRSTTEEEDWGDGIIRDNDQHVVYGSDMEIDGWEFKLGLGYLHNLKGSWEIKQRVFIGRREINFKRQKFEYTGTPSSDNSMEKEKVTLNYVEYSPYFIYKAKDKLTVSFSPGIAYVLKGKSYNSSYDVTFNSDEGIIARLEGQLNYKFTEVVTGYMGVMGEWQHLEGDDTTIEEYANPVEWPDNDLYTYGVSFGVTFSL